MFKNRIGGLILLAITVHLLSSALSVSAQTANEIISGCDANFGKDPNQLIQAHKEGTCLATIRTLIAVIPTALGSNRCPWSGRD